MTTTREHYAHHLGPIYSWMAGGLDAALTRGGAELDALGMVDGAGAVAVDLGAGFGVHAIPLARRGFAVLAVDSDAALLAELSSAAGSTAVQTVHGDLLDFRLHLRRQARVVLCMGDTLTHLSDLAAIDELFTAVTAALETGGVFVLSFRNYCDPLVAERRFIPVRSDANRILTCFLEYSATHVTVHDLLHERGEANWNFRVSAYRKLRLDPAWVTTALESRGLTVARDTTSSGMIHMTARKPGPH